MCQKQLEVELPTRRRELAMIETNNYNAHHNVHNQAPNSSLHFDGPKFHMCIMPLQHLKYNQLYRSITSRCNCTFFDITTRSTLELQSDYRSLIMREPPSFPLVHTTKEFWGEKMINWFVARKKSIISRHWIPSKESEICGILGISQGISRCKFLVASSFEWRCGASCHSCTNGEWRFESMHNFSIVLNHLQIGVSLRDFIATALGHMRHPSGWVVTDHKEWVVVMGEVYALSETRKANEYEFCLWLWVPTWLA